jgi:hypothetical protein
MRHYCDLEKHYSDTTGKLHTPCPFKEITGVNVHVIVKNGICYRSRQCMIVRCKFNCLQADLESLLSIVW